jgi:hypothetical protein
MPENKFSLFDQSTPTIDGVSPTTGVPPSSKNEYTVSVIVIRI